MKPQKLINIILSITLFSCILNYYPAPSILSFCNPPLPYISSFCKSSSSISPFCKGGLRGLAAFAEEKKDSIAILDLIATNISKEEAGMLTDRLRSEIMKTGKFEIMEREKMDLILKEQGFQETGFCNTTECSVQIGQLLAVNRIVTGSVGKMGNLYSINLRLLDVETGKNLKTTEEDCMCPIEDVMLYSVRKVAYKLADMPYTEPELVKTVNPSLSIGIININQPKSDFESLNKSPLDNTFDIFELVNP